MRVLAIVHQPDAAPASSRRPQAAATGSTSSCCPEVPEPPADPFGEDAVLTLGGAMHPDQDERDVWLAEVDRLLGELIAAGKPLLGLCLGARWLAQAV